jgi:hypothetical protein
MIHGGLDQKEARFVELPDHSGLVPLLHQVDRDPGAADGTVDEEAVSRTNIVDDRIGRPSGVCVS